MSEGNIQVYRRKKLKLCRDRSINDLPDDVLTKIISHLPMVYAVRTSVLSKDWRYKWASSDRIQIFEHPKKFKKSSLVNFIDNVLLHTDQNLQGFSLTCHSLRDPTNFKAWISYVSMSTRIRRIKINSSGCIGTFTMPSCIFDITSLDEFLLRLPCTMEFPLKDYFCTLKTLVLMNVDFKIPSNDDQQLKLTFPSLTFLILQRCTWGDNVKFVEISSPSLTSFNYSARWHPPVDHDFLIKISGAKVQEFYKGEYVHLSNFDLNTASMVFTRIEMDPWRDHPFIGPSGSKSRLSIKDLSGLITMKIIGHLFKPYAQLMPGLALPSFHRLRDLTIQVCGSMEAVIELLHMMPVLKLLVIIPHAENGYTGSFKGDFDFGASGCVPSCMSSHLIEVRFNEFSGAKRQLLLAKFLLKNSPKLAKLDVCLLKEPLIRKSLIKKKLLTYPTSSDCVSFLFA